MKCARPTCPNIARIGKDRGYCQKHYAALQNKGYQPAEPVRERIRLLRERGVSTRGIAAAAQITGAGLAWIVNERSERVQYGTAERIMSIPVPLRLASSHVPVPAIGSQRRIQALIAYGYTQRHLCRESGVSIDNLSRIHHQHFVRAETANRVAAVFNRLQLTPGPDNRSRIRGRREGWPRPFAWDEDTIDDPNAEPYQGRDKWVPFMERYQELRELNLTHREIAQVLGIQLESLERTLRRNLLMETA